MIDRKDFMYVEIREHLPYCDETQLEKIYKILFNKSVANPERQKMRQIFLKGYEKRFGAPYYWEAKDSTALRSLHTKIKKLCGDNKESQFIVNSFRVYLNQALQDKWIADHFDISILNSQFNKIIKRGLNTEKIANDTREQFEQWLNS